MPKKQAAEKPAMVKLKEWLRTSIGINLRYLLRKISSVLPSACTFEVCDDVLRGDVRFVRKTYRRAQFHLQPDKIAQYAQHRQSRS